MSFVRVLRSSNKNSKEFQSDLTEFWSDLDMKGYEYRSKFVIKCRSEFAARVWSDFNRVPDGV